jgi:hypothetical protein
MADGNDEAPPGVLNEAAIARLAVLPEMEWRTTVLRLMANLSGRVDENTEITADTQEVLNRDVLGKVSEMYDIFDTARKFFVFLGRVGAAGMWCIETGGKLAKPMFWIAAFGAATWAWWKTGTFVLPNWTILK